MSAATAVETQLLTAEEALRLPGNQWELVRGELQERPMGGWQHGRYGTRLGVALLHFVEEHGLGEVIIAETGYLLARNPDTVRRPDAAFISAAKVVSQAPEGWVPVAPDLVVEVVSPNDRIRDVEAKVEQWLDAGVALVWVAYPGWRAIHVHRRGREIRLLTETEALDGEDLLPGFALTLRELFG